MKTLETTVACLCVCLGAFATGAAPIAPSDDAGANTDAILAAIDAAFADGGGTVELGEGLFTITNRIAVKAGVTLSGASREKTVIKQTVTGKGCLSVAAATADLPAATVEKLTITGVSSSNSGSSNPSAVWMDGGTMSYCIVSNNTTYHLYAYYGCGIQVAGEGVRIDHSIIQRNYNSFRGNGGGLRVGSKLKGKTIVDTCLITDNGSTKVAEGSGAGIYCESPTVLLNCTIAGNVTSHTEQGRRNGGGAYFEKTCYVTNCVFSGNQAPNDEMDGRPNWAGVTPVGANNFFGDGSTTFGDNPQSAPTASFRDATHGDYSLTAISGAKGSGFWYDGIPEDVAGAARKAPVDIGCYVYDASKEPFSCPAQMSPTEAFVDQKVSFGTTLVNPPAGGSFTYAWKLTDQFGNERTLADSATPNEAIPVAGFYTVALEVRNQNAPYQKVNSTVEGTLHIAVRTNYVTSVTTAKPEYPYDTPGKATMSLNAAIAETIDGATVILDEGTHKLTALVEVAGVRIFGAGSDKTIVDAQKSYRAFYLHDAAAVLEGISISGGYSGSGASGAAVSIAGTGGTVRNCRIYSNISSQMNGSGDIIALGSAGALVENCVITNNQGTTIGGSNSSIVEVGSGILRNCLIARNFCNYKDKTTIIECAVVGVGGAGTLENCTIVSNRTIGVTSQSVALELAKGATVRNVIVADNFAVNNVLEPTSAVAVPNWSRASAQIQVSHCAIGNGCASLGSDPADGGSILFKDAANGNWRLSRDSSCIGVGLNAAWMETATDLDGKARRAGRRVDLGCYEADPPGLQLLVR